MTTIRPMQPADKEAVLAMMEVFYASPAVLSNGSAAIFSSDFEACINDNPYLEGYMFEENGQIQGYAMAAKSFSTEFGRPCIWVEDLYIKEDFRGTGIGSLFLEFIEKKYPEAVLRLEVEEENGRALKSMRKTALTSCVYGNEKTVITSGHLEEFYNIFYILSYRHFRFNCSVSYCDHGNNFLGCRNF